MSRLKDKIIFIAGASSGMGRETARRAGQEGATVIVAARRFEACAALAKDIGPSAVALEMDGTNPDSVEATLAEITRRFGKLDGAFNNLGSTFGMSRLHEMDLDLWHKALDTNLTAPFLLMRAELPLLIAAGGGAIINNSSVAGIAGTKNLANYSASKWGLIGLGQSVALEYGDENIRVNTIAPGIIQTEKAMGMMETVPDFFVPIRAGIPGGRFGDMSDVANLVTWLLSDEARYINGITIRVDGGQKAG